MYSVSDSSHKLHTLCSYIYCSDSFYNQGSAIAKKNQTAHLLIKLIDSVVSCQRYVCPNIISMTMNVIIQECIIENCFIERYV